MCLAIVGFSAVGHVGMFHIISPCVQGQSRGEEGRGCGVCATEVLAVGAQCWPATLKAPCLHLKQHMVTTQSPVQVPSLCVLLSPSCMLPT